MALGLLAVLSVAAAAGLLVRLHVLPTGLSPVRDAVSDYGWTPFHRNYRAMVVLFGASGLFLGLGLGASTDAVALYWLWIYGAARIAIAWFMTDENPPPLSRAGRIHLVLAFTAFASIALAGANVRWSSEPTLIPPLGTALWIVAVLTFLAMVLPVARRTVFGLVERALYVATIAWLLTAAFGLTG